MLQQLNSLVCTTCDKELPIEMFHKNRSKRTGYNSQCKSCVSVAHSAWRKENAEHLKQYRAVNAEKFRKDAAARHRTPEGRAKRREAAKRERERDPVKCKARQAVRYAIRKKRLIEQPCEVCGCSEVVGHHDDYSKPLDVRWLCHIHHNQVHNKLLEK